MVKLKGKSAVITGASQGIGRAIALRLAERGVHSILAGRDMRRLDAVMKSVAANGGTAESLELDLADERSVMRFTAAVSASRAQLDILVNCAGAYARGRWKESSSAQLKQLLETNVLGVFTLTRDLMPLLERARGDVVFVNSTIVEGHGGGAGLYAATKHALIGLADSLRAEVNESGVRVMSVYPGRTATIMQEAVHADERIVYRPERLLQARDIAEVVVACLELGETAEVTDLSIRPRHKP